MLDEDLEVELEPVDVDVEGVDVDIEETSDVEEVSDVVFPSVVVCESVVLSSSSFGWNPDSVLDDILDGHGASLIELELKGRSGEYDLVPQPVQKHSLARIGQSCSRLQRLALTLNRTEGDSEEVALYRLLGHLPQLKYVSLTLYIAKTWDCIHDSMHLGNIEEDTIDSRFDDEFDRKIPIDETETSNGIHRNRLINCALDPALGRAIFAAISRGKPKSATPLEKLSIQMVDVDRFGETSCLHEVGEVLRYLSRPLQATRNLRSDCRDELLVERQELVPKTLSEIPNWLEEIWCRVWPEKLADLWWNDWHSLPLASIDA